MQSLTGFTGLRLVLTGGLTSNVFSAMIHVSRLLRLLEEIMSEKENKTIIFVETKRRCDDLTRRMRRDG